MGKLCFFTGAMALAGVASSADFALHFSSTSKALIPSSKNLTATRGLTMECWIKPDVEQPHQFFRYILSNNVNATGYGLLLKLGLDVQTTGFGQFPVIVKPGEWTHLALAHNNRITKLYVDGKLVHTDTVTELLRPNDLPLWVGSSPFVGLPGDQPTGFSGLIDEVRVWKTPRSQTQIRRDMKRAISGRTRNLQVYLRFNEGTGDEARNLTGKTKKLMLGLPNQENTKPSWEIVPSLAKR